MIFLPDEFYSEFMQEVEMKEELPHCATLLTLPPPPFITQFGPFRRLEAVYSYEI